jgi:alpha-1,2-mannosyltransferase
LRKSLRQLAVILGLNIGAALLNAATAAPFVYSIGEAVTGVCSNGWLGVEEADEVVGSLIPGCNTLSHTYSLLGGGLDQDSWWVMREAFSYWSQDPGNRTFYHDLLVEKNIKFQYPPASLFIPLLLTELHIKQKSFYFLMTYVSLLTTILAVAAISLHSLRKFGRELLPWRDMGLSLILIGLLTLTYYPIVKAGSLGQIQAWLNAVFAVSLLCHLKGRPALAGILVGLMASVKPQYGLFLLWGLFRGDRRFTLAMLGTVVAGAIAGMWVFGISMYFDYLDGLGYLSRHGEAFFPNQSVNGLLNRLFSISQPELSYNIEFPGSFPPYSPWVYYPTIITGLAIVALCLLGRRSNQAYGQGADYCLMALGITTASPIAWEHHYGILIAIFAFLWPVLWFSDSFAGERRWRLILAVCYLLSSNLISLANLLSPTYLNFLQSYLLFAALGVYVILLKMRQRSYVA